MNRQDEDVTRVYPEQWEQWAVTRVVIKVCTEQWEQWGNSMQDAGQGFREQTHQYGAQNPSIIVHANAGPRPDI